MDRLHQLDIILIIGYLLGMMIIGVVLGRRQKTDQDYFLGGRNLRWWMVGISMVVSDIGALELVGVAGSASPPDDRASRLAGFCPLSGAGEG